MNKYYEEINRLRGIAILLVLLGHSVILAPINLMEIKWCQMMYKYIYLFHMPLFFIISGFLFNYKGNYTLYLKSKINRILIPYIAFGCINLLSRHLMPNLVNGNNTIIEDISNIFYKGGEYWFLYTLFIIYIIFPKIEKFLQKNIQCLIIIVTLIFIRNFQITSFMRLDTLVVYIVYFIIGYKIKNIYDIGFKDKILNNNIFIFSILLFIISGIYTDSTIISIIGAITGSIISYNILNRIYSVNINKFLNICGDCSLQLYLLNGFILVPTRIIVVKLLNIYNPFFIIAVIFTLNVTIGLCIINIIINKVSILCKICGIKEKTVHVI